MVVRHSRSILSLFSLLTYLVAVGLGVVDVATHGLGDHDHHGQPCQVHHFLGLSEALDVPVAAAFVAPVIQMAIAFQYDVAPLTAASFLPYQARDPPTALLS